MESTTLPCVTISGFDYSYTPSYQLGALDWFHLAECARKRMTDHSTDIHRWRGERRSFYSSLQKMDVDGVRLMD